MSEAPRIGVPDAPASGATIDLFNSVTAFGAKQMRALDIRRIIVAFLQVSHASAANGLKSYASTDGGTNWDTVDFDGTMPKAIDASSTSTDVIEDFKVSQYDDFKLTYENSANTLTAWRVGITLQVGDVNPGT